MTLAVISCILSHVFPCLKIISNTMKKKKKIASPSRKGSHFRSASAAAVTSQSPSFRARKILRYNVQPVLFALHGPARLGPARPGAAWRRRACGRRVSVCTVHALVCVRRCHVTSKFSRPFWNMIHLFRMGRIEVGGGATHTKSSWAF